MELDVAPCVATPAVLRDERATVLVACDHRSPDGGRAFFTTPENLGDYVLVDFIEHKRALRSGRGGRRAG